MYIYSPCCCFCCYPFCENEKGDIFFFCRPYKVLSYDDDNSTPSTRNEIFSKWQTVLTLGSWLLSAFCLSLSGPALLRIDINELLKLQRSSRLQIHTLGKLFTNYNLLHHYENILYFLRPKCFMIFEILNGKRVNLYKMTKYLYNF